MISSYSNPLTLHNKRAWVLLLSLVGISIGGILFIGQVLALAAVFIMNGGDLSALQEVIRNPIADPDNRWALLTMQGMASIGGFILAPLIFYCTMLKGNLLDDFIPTRGNTGLILLTVIWIVFSFMIVNTAFIEWNANIKLPASMAGFEKWAMELEESLASITEYLTKFDSLAYFIASVFVIAVIPGIGEELLFRGFLQNIFRQMIKNDHVAIWLTAFLFSAIHFQFYGFVPRMLLGALFGYLYLWTGNLIVPILAHFLNNFISVLALYIYQQGLIDINVESTEALPMPYIIAFSILFIIAIVYFKKYLAKNNNDEGLVRGL